jgi:DNA-binding ferritin-like protein
MVIITLLCTFRDLEKIMPNVAEQVVKEVAEGLKTYGFRPLDSTAEKLLKGQIMEIVKDNHKIRQLVRKLTSSRFLQFIFKYNC